MIVMRPKQRGYAVLAMTLVVLLSVTLLAIFLTKYIVSDHHGVQNTYRAQQAHQAAQAGLEYAIKYAETNKDTISDGQALTGTLTNSATYSAVINFIGGTNETLHIVSTGTSADSVATKVIGRWIKWYESAGSVAMQVPLLVKGTVTMSGNTEITNLENNNTIDTGAGAVSFSGNAETVISSGTGSDSSGIGADINLNNTTLSGYSDAQFEQSILGVTITSLFNSLSGAATITYTNTGNTNYNSELDNVTGQTIYLNQNGGTAEINGNTDIGTPGSPVTIVVNGSISIQGNAVIYGDIVVTGNASLQGNTDIAGDVVVAGDMSLQGNTEIEGLTLASGDVDTQGNLEIEGGLAIGGTYTASGNTEIEYDSINLTGGVVVSGSYYGAISGSWKDYQ